MSAAVDSSESAAPDGAEVGGFAEGDVPDDGELTVTITPFAEALDDLQVTEAEFEAALVAALDRLEDLPDDEEPAPLEEAEIVLNGRTFRLEEVAEIEIGGDPSELGEFPDPADPTLDEAD